MKFDNIKQVLAGYDTNYYFSETGKLYVPHNGHFDVFLRDRSKRWVKQEKAVLQPSFKSMLVKE